MVVLALGLRVLRLGRQELWLDEAFSVFMAGTPDFLAEALADNTGPLYYLLLRGWTAVAGPSEVAVRLPSALCGTAFVGAVIWAGRAVFDSRVALWSGVIAAVSPIHIYYSQEARAYALLTLLLAAALGALWRAFDTNAWRWWAAAAGAMALALYTHYFAALGLLPTAFLLGLWRERARWVRYGSAVLASGIAFLPWAVASAFSRKAHLGGLSWIGPVWEHTSPFLAIPLSLEVFGLGSQRGLLTIQLKQLTFLDYPQGLRWLGIAGFAVAGLWAVLPAADPVLGTPGVRSRKAWLVVSLLAPLVVLLVGSFRAPFYVIGRYDLVAFPAFPLLIGLGLGKIHRRPRVGPGLAALAAVILLIPIGVKLTRYYEAPSTDLIRGVVRALDAGVRDRDAVLLTGGRSLALPVLYYLGRLGYRQEGEVCRQDSSGRQFPCRVLAGPGRPGALAAALEPGARLWVFFGGGFVQGGRLKLWGQDSDLVRGLIGTGLRSELVETAPFLVRFRRP